MQSMQEIAEHFDELGCCALLAEFRRIGATEDTAHIGKLLHMAHDVETLLQREIQSGFFEKFLRYIFKHFPNIVQGDLCVSRFLPAKEIYEALQQSPTFSDMLWIAGRLESMDMRVLEERREIPPYIIKFLCDGLREHRHRIPGLLPQFTFLAEHFQDMRGALPVFLGHCISHKNVGTQSFESTWNVCAAEDPATVLTQQHRAGVLNELRTTMVQDGELQLLLF